MATKILVIDDHPDTMQLIELSLQRQGYSVLGARNLREQRPVEESLHVIMLDFRTGAGLPRSAVENYIKYPLFDVLHIYGADLADAVNAGKSLVEMHPFAPVSYHFQALAGRSGVVEQKV